MTSSLPKDTYSDSAYEKAHQDTFAPPKSRAIKPVLPSGVSQVDFDKALEDFTSAVGKGNVFVKQALAHYIDPYELHEDESKGKVPSAAICPASVDELSRVLQIANTYGIPLWTFSRGKNLGYGGPAPRLNGSVALDLHRMNRILEVNDEHAYAVVEPGVTFSDLYEYCVKHKKKVWPSTPSLGWGSVVGNSLDRGTGFGSLSNQHQCISGLEVMLADGELVRTGQFGITNSPSAFISKFTFGPSIEGLFLQSNLGIVTKLGMWMMPQPPAYMACSFSMPENEDVEVMVDVFGEMRRNGMIPNVVWMVNLIESLCVRGRRRDLWKGEGPIPEWRLKELQKELGTGFWTARWGLYGPAKTLETQLADIREHLRKRAPTGTLCGTLYSGENGNLLEAKSVPTEHGLMWVGVPSLFSLPLMDWAIVNDATGKPAHGDYAPIIPSSGKKVLDWVQQCKPLYQQAGVDFMADFFMHERHVIFTSMYAFDQQDAEQRKGIESLHYGMHDIATAKGYGMYRAHVHHMDMIAELNDFNNGAYRRFVEKLKASAIQNPAWFLQYYEVKPLIDMEMGLTRVANEKASNFDINHAVSWHASCMSMRTGPFLFEAAAGRFGPEAISQALREITDWAITAGARRSCIHAAQIFKLLFHRKVSDMISFQSIVSLFHAGLVLGLYIFAMPDVEGQDDIDLFDDVDWVALGTTGLTDSSELRTSTVHTLPAARIIRDGGNFTISGLPLRNGHSQARKCWLQFASLMLGLGRWKSRIFSRILHVMCDNLSDVDLGDSLDEE
ncbi:hypothetical protein CkaCkLH20_09533 [Colletotrichum karsti]|uniref:FAD-binding PCMH-type domain-containing protein n=1 Tax=Colletotrichum karsti TaxID=1095194 RepID=A0A9P6HWZ0_9PEZI|nr:uncharacterized protein CkaCkLH20_09533 [Colletotrichum karsti]KAF9873023.1 hypothetical protein CkaCkLH20_09533 [Colletotrichum karsti]